MGHAQKIHARASSWETSVSGSAAAIAGAETGFLVAHASGEWPGWSASELLYNQRTRAASVASIALSGGMNTPAPHLWSSPAPPHLHQRFLWLTGCGAG